MSKSPAVFDEQKLRWMNGRYLRELEPAELARRLEELLGRDGLEDAAAVAQEKMQTLADFWPLAAFLVERQPYDEKAWRKVMEREGAGANLAAVREALAAVEPFELEIGGGGASRGGRGHRSEAPGRVPAAARGHQRLDDLARHLRVRGRTRPRRDARARR